MKRTSLVGLLALPLWACTPGTPSQLVPTFDSLIGLPGLPDETACDGEDCCLREGWCLDVETLSLRNVGTSAVVIESVSFSDDSSAAFTDLEVSTLEVGPREQASLRFRYTTPGGEAQSGTIVIVSNAEVTPTLEVDVETRAYTPPQPDDAGPQQDAGTGTGSDAGPEEAEEDAGSDAG